MLTPIVKEAIHRKIDEWVQEAFFNGTNFDVDQFFETVSRYMPNRGDSLKIRVCDSPIKCQLVAHEEGKQEVSSFMGRLWESAEMRCSEVAWSFDWCETFPVFKTAEKLNRFNNIQRLINRLTHEEIRDQNKRRIHFADDNLFSRFEKTAFYDFIGEYKLIINPHFLAYKDFLKTGCFLSIFLKGCVIISRRPKAIHMDAQGRLHKDGSPAIEWHDGSGYYFLNDVLVPREIAIQSAESLDPDLILTTNNAGVRREIVRKIGIERILSKLGGRILDSWNGYELVSLAMPNMRITPIYLKMRNPSIGTYHVEGVPPHIQTCKAALSWRTGGLRWNPKQLT